MNMRTHIRLMLLGLLAFVAYAPATFAASETTQFLVTAKVDPACSVSATDLNFGTYSGSSANDLDGTSTISVTCISGVVYQVGLSFGVNGGGPTARFMYSGLFPKLAYQLYDDPARTVVWDMSFGLNHPSVKDGTGDGSAQPFTVYGRIPHGQTSVPMGAWSDTITVTVNF